jgi:hypothetical protein
MNVPDMKVDGAVLNILLQFAFWLVAAVPSAA